MIRSMRVGLLLSTTVLALVAAPVVLNATPFSDLSAVAGGKGNGNGGGGGSGGSDQGNSGSSEHGNSGGKSEKSGKSSEKSGKSSQSGTSSQSGKSKSGKKVATTELTTTTKKGKPDKTKNIHAQLGGLNSLNRNINGLMNSSDPRMEQIRAYIEASAALEEANANLEQAQTDLTTAMDAYNTYAGTFELMTYEDGLPYADLSLAALQERALVLEDAVAADEANTDAAAELELLNTAIEQITNSPELAAVTEAEGVVEQYEADVAANEELTSQDALRAALLAAANKNRVAEAGGEAYLTPEIMAWATGVLGVGDADGLIDDYIAQQ